MATSAIDNTSAASAATLKQRRRFQKKMHNAACAEIKERRDSASSCSDTEAESLSSDELSPLITARKTRTSNNSNTVRRYNQPRKSLERSSPVENKLFEPKKKMIRRRRRVNSAASKGQHQQQEGVQQQQNCPSTKGALKNTSQKQQSKRQISSESKYIEGSSPAVKQQGHACVTTKRRSSISFAATITVKEVTPITQLADPQQIWFQQSEFQNMRAKAITIVNRVQSGDFEDKNYCTRGLEGYLSQKAGENNSIHSRREIAWQNVFSLQSNQQKRGTYNDNDISNVYRLSALESKKEAVKRASLDAAAVQIYLRQTKRKWRRVSV